ncbi:MAG: sigma-70 family RNA polymerase sigma factor [Sedimentisphaerales bacterium]|nr:sigma-70 family RNA polymerase sigma factor [Sedimentisphaerales bacterium]
MSEPTDEKLVRASCTGDKSAYAVLAQKHYQRVFVVCLGMLGRVHDAEDVAQETMLKGLLKIKDLRTPSQFGSWIVKIARNDCISLIRTREFAKNVKIEKETSTDETLIPYESLQQAIDKLPYESRLPLVMYYFGGESVKDVAQKLNLSRSRVYQKLRIATRQLHQLLKQQGDVI